MFRTQTVFYNKNNNNKMHRNSLIELRNQSNLWYKKKKM